MTSTFTLTGTFLHQDGITPVVGSPIQIKADPFPVAGALLAAGQNVSTDSSGKISVSLTTGISGLYYVITSTSKIPLFSPQRFLAPGAGSTLDLSSVVFYNPSGANPFLSQVLAVTSPRQLPQANAAGTVGPFSNASFLTADGNTHAVGYDQVDGLLIGAGQSNIFTSTDHGATWSSGKGIPLSGQSNPGNTVGNIIRFAALWVCMMTDQSTGCAAIFTSPAPGSGGTCTWTLRQNLTTGSLGYFSPCLDSSGTTLLAGEYGDPLVTGTPTLHVWRSTNGTSWTSVFTLTGSGARHVHAVYPDSFVTSQWWMTLGDGPSPCLYRSVNDGVTWTGVTAIDSSRQSVQISDDATYLYLAADATSLGTPCDVWVVDKATLTTVRSGSIGDHRRLAVPDPGRYQFGVFTNASTTMNDFNAANFAAHMKGALVISTAVPAGTTVASVTNTVQLVLSANATSTTFNTPYRIIAPEHFATDPFYGCVDPATGIYYFTTPGDSGTNIGNAVHRGLFAIPYVGGPVILLDQVDSPPRALFVANGWVYCGNQRRPALVPA